MKPLDAMSLEELWELFPIILEPHQDIWSHWYEAEADFLKSQFKQEIFQIHHIGSTAILDIMAKPIIDILIETKADSNWIKLQAQICECGYRCMSQSTERISFNKGYLETGFAKQVYHLHVRKPYDVDECYFRDYLIDHPMIAKEYEALKLSLWKPFEHNRDAYTMHKTAFIQEMTEKAKQQYQGRYD